MPSLQEQQWPIDVAICNAMVESTPEEWTTIVLDLWRTKENPNPGEFAHSLSTPQGLPPVMPVDALYEATQKLDHLFRAYGKVLGKAKYKATLENGNWKLVADFEYLK